MQTAVIYILRDLLEQHLNMAIKLDENSPEMAAKLDENTITMVKLADKFALLTAAKISNALQHPGQ